MTDAGKGRIWRCQSRALIDAWYLTSRSGQGETQLIDWLIDSWRLTASQPWRSCLEETKLIDRFLRFSALSITKVTSRRIARLPITSTAVTAATVFKFTHPPVLSALLLILSASRFLAPGSPLLVPAPFLFSVHLHGMTFPFFSDRNPLSNPLNETSRQFFPKKL